MPTRFAHSNLIAKDWRALARFYERVLDCRVDGPERDLVGPAMDELTGMPGTHVQGVHLRVPGHGPDGPTLEIFTYDEQPSPGPKLINAPGIAHLAFEVDDVRQTLRRVLEHGGSQVGGVTSLAIPGAGTVTLIYARDPEENIVELQSWSQERDSASGEAEAKAGE